VASDRGSLVTSSTGPTFMTDIATILGTVLTVYALATGIFLISENRAPQAPLHRALLKQDL
jgi:hypothetical protein